MAPIRPVLLRVYDAARDVLFPPRCVGCDELLPPATHPPVIFCPRCRELWDTARTDAAEEAARSAVQGHAYLTFYRSGQTDGVPERLIYHLKHLGDHRSFAIIADELCFSVQIALRAAIAALPDDAPTPSLPPLFTYPPRRPSAVNKDGFDQAKRLARALARVSDGEYATLLDRTHRSSREQKKLDADERAVNAAESYRLSAKASDRIRGRVVVLCDDLCTTGSTLAECEKQLLFAGAACVVWVTVARTASE